MSVLWIALGLIALQRVATIALSVRNSQRLLARGGIEAAPVQFPLIAAAQFAWLLCMAVLIPPQTVPQWWLLGLCAAIEIAHCWAILSLGEYWSTRVIVVPGEKLVRRGPYRFVKHPNYLAVFLEVLLLPAAFGAYALGVGFAVLYVLLVAWRLRDENRLLARLAE